MSKHLFKQLGNNQKTISDQVYQLSNEVFDNQQKLLAMFRSLEAKWDYLAKLISNTHLSVQQSESHSSDIMSCEVTISQLAELAEVSTSQVYSLIRRGVIPEPIKHGSKPAYYKGDSVADILYLIWEKTRRNTNKKPKLRKQRE